MIVGSGMIAKALQRVGADNDTQTVYFASGVSNSRETASHEYAREKELFHEVRATSPDARIVYFSTISVLDPMMQENPYIRHKLEMEQEVVSQGNGLALRCPNIIGPGGNPHTLINYLIDSFRRDSTIRLWKRAERNFLWVDHLAVMAMRQATLRKAGILDILHPYTYSIPEIIAVFQELKLGDPEISWEDKGVPYVPAVGKENLPLFREFGIPTGVEYLATVIRKKLDSE